MAMCMNDMNLFRESAKFKVEKVCDVITLPCSSKLQGGGNGLQLSQRGLQTPPK